MLDIMMLKAVPDACSDVRLERARRVAADPEAPRRALVSMPDQRAAPPHDYLDAIATLPPADTYGTPAADAWFAGRQQRLNDVDAFAARAAITAAVDGAHPDDGLSEIDLDDRIAGFEAMPDADKQAWGEAFRQIATDWLDTAAAEFADARDQPRTAGWGHEAVTYRTVDGGLLLVCAADDGGAYDGVAAWFEATLFVLAEVAEAAGVHAPTRFDVT
ncbi:MAG: hypothetical protein EA388_12215 [Nitriliruptor sp.]|nr:MAG: hypothetical protein EA388_12215 [Nitriliruptor sp.]